MKICVVVSNVRTALSRGVPQGWDVDAGPPAGAAAVIEPALLVSLTAPKPCARHFRGAHHWLGGRFVPPTLARQLRLALPPFPGAAQAVRLR